MRAIIADTGPLYAAIDIDDQYHQRSKTQIQRINAENLTILVPFPVYLETYNLLLYRLGTEQAIKFARDCIESVYFINPSQEQYIAAAEKTAFFPDQKITLCDAITAILSEEMKLQIWTYDYHFDVMKVQVWR
ncbi:MAG: PIN domain-containing protein [Sphaerospermopsis sp.]|uniref:type II toxin-antitoxin system VapC family toxin n=1 Tax=Sphaerospermopsis sp. LEGE 00249 TaxID=1380707 RepID=UPI00164D7F0A|nr:PIN domain-containing protein [Sphaerospermopsis sp. LEGE 00249]MBC5796359.1 type II toxin-antitoxin system VapC family toxin [Sphaerospermopsis sp. LEGE 00249]MEB3148999.1 PIN domain-containing protein [Sphaerospermopsis sp.]